MYPRMNTNSGWSGQVDNSSKIQLFDNSTKQLLPKNYYQLFWEGKKFQPFQINTKSCFCIAGKDTEKFLEKILIETIGMNVKESNDLITTWLPQLETYPYNLIEFLMEDCDTLNQFAKLDLSPKPDSLIRTWMLVQHSKTNVNCQHPSLSSLRRKRTGYVVTEWGVVNVTKDPNTII